MNDVATAADVFLQAAHLNNNDPLLSGSVLEFPNYGQLVMTGDLHGNRKNFEKLKRFCDLEHSGPRHVMLHEIVHEEVTGLNDPDMSHEVLLSAAEWKCEFPDQVHFLLSNHELAQLQRQEITKNGRVVTMDFDAGLTCTYGKQFGRVSDAINEFIRSLPLAGRTQNRVLLSHSLPSPRELHAFDATVLSRKLTREDRLDRGAAHQMVWGRYHTGTSLDTLSELFEVDFFICGHQPQETGYDVFHDRMVILASEHNHGVFLPFDLSKPLTIERLTKNIRPFAGIA